MCDNENCSYHKNNLFYLIGIIVAAAAVVAGAVITAMHFIKKRNTQDDELVYEIDCSDEDCENCEFGEECTTEETTED